MALERTSVKKQKEILEMKDRIMSQTHCIHIR